MDMLFKAPALAMYVIGGIWSFWLSLVILSKIAGVWLLVLGFFLAPITLYLAPWYAGLVWGDWFPLLLGYGATIVAGILFGIGQAFDGKRG